jgi:hypothetical protein
MRNCGSGSRILVRKLCLCRFVWMNKSMEERLVYKKPNPADANSVTRVLCIAECSQEDNQLQRSAELYLSPITGASSLLSNIHQSDDWRRLRLGLQLVDGFWFASCGGPLPGFAASSSRKRLRALCNWDFEFPTEYPKRLAISS